MSTGTYIEISEDVASNSKTCKIVISATDYTEAKLTNFDYALLEDIDHGKPSSTPIADQLLGLEMIVRRIEEAKARKVLKESKS
jgi:hypothetical protein